MICDAFCCDDLEAGCVCCTPPDRWFPAVVDMEMSPPEGVPAPFDLPRKLEYFSTRAEWFCFSVRPPKLPPMPPGAVASKRYESL